MRRLLAPLLLLAAAAPLRADEPRAIIQAHGGADNLERCTASRMTFEGRIPAAETLNLKMSGTWLLQGHDRQKIVFRVTLEGQDFEAIELVAGGKGWRRWTGPGQQEGDVSPEELKLMEAGLQEAHARSLLPLLRDGKFTLTALPETVLQGRPAVGVKASYPNRPDVSLWFDRETYLLVKTAYPYRRPGPEGTPDGVLERLYEDYRTVGEEEERLLARAGVKAEGPALLAYLAKQKPDPAAVERARTLVKLLADESFEVREKAGKDLVALGPPALGALHRATRDDDLEVSRRALACAEKIRERASPETTRAAARLLAARAPDGAAEALLAVLPAVEGAVADDVLSALAELAGRPGRPNPVIVRALDDRDPVRREAARAVLRKDGGAYLDRPGRLLFPAGVRVPYRRVLSRDGGTDAELTITDIRFFNRFDDKEFSKP